MYFSRLFFIVLKTPHYRTYSQYKLVSTSTAKEAYKRNVNLLFIRSSRANAASCTIKSTCTLKLSIILDTFSSNKFQAAMLRLS